MIGPPRTISELTIDRLRHGLCTYFEGTLVGTFAITELDPDGWCSQDKATQRDPYLRPDFSVQ